MTLHLPVPSDTEPDAVADLIADARLVPLPRRAVVDLTALPHQRGTFLVSDVSLSLVEGYGDYGSC